MTNCDKFQLSIEQLEEQNANHQPPNPAPSDLDREDIAESVIQRLEICYDCLWKVLMRYLAEELGVTNPPNNLKPVFRLVFENSLPNAPLTQWLQIRKGLSCASVRLYK